MRKLTLILIVAVAAVALFTVAFACEAEKSAKAAKAEAAGCGHGQAAAMKAEGKGCAHAEAAAMKAEGKGCAHADAAAMKAEGGCAHGKVTDAQRAALSKGQNVTLVGRVVCESCDLKSAKSCKSVFKTDTGELYAIVTSEAFEKLSSETRHGEKRVEVTGTAAKDGDASIVQLQSFKILS